MPGDLLEEGPRLEHEEVALAIVHARKVHRQPPADVWVLWTTRSRAGRLLASCSRAETLAKAGHGAIAQHECAHGHWQMTALRRVGSDRGAQGSKPWREVQVATEPSMRPPAWPCAGM
jgi:hypothetical protein